MSKPLTVIKYGIFLFIGAGILSEFMTSETPPIANDGPQLASLPASSQSENSFAMHPLNNSWPPLSSDQQQSTQISEDLLAANYYVVLDGSGSMRDVECSEGQPKMDVAKNALTVFSQSLPANVNLGLLAFDNGGVFERVPLGGNNGNLFAQAISQVMANRNTPLGSAIGEAYNKLEAQARRQLGYGEYHLVIITDGKASPSEDPTPVVNQILDNAPVVFHTIGFCIGDDHSLNQPGRTYYQSANDPTALGKGLQDVLAEAPNFSVSEFTE